MKVVSDAGPLISLSNTCLLWVLNRTPFDIVIPPWVLNEVLRFPKETKHYKLSALRISELLKIGKIREEALGEKGEALAERILETANKIYYVRKRPLKIIQRGEAEAAALAALGDKVLLIDERTLRMTVEDPNEFRYVLQSRTGTHVRLDMRRAEELQDLIGDVLMLRSVDLIAYLYESGRLDKDIEFVEAAMYGLKYVGCAVSEQEIKEFLLG